MRRAFHPLFLSTISALAPPSARRRAMARPKLWAAPGSRSLPKEPRGIAEQQKIAVARVQAERFNGADRLQFLDRERMIRAHAELRDAEPLDQESERGGIVNQGVVKQFPCLFGGGLANLLSQRRDRFPAMHETRQHQPEHTATVAEGNLKLRVPGQDSAGHQ